MFDENTIQKILSQNLKVWYGYARLTKKIVKKKQLVIFYENDNHNREKNEAWVRQKINVIYERFQTEKEKQDALSSNRTFTKYGYFIDNKPYSGNIDLVLEQNFKVESNNVSLEERTTIRDKLKLAYRTQY